MKLGGWMPEFECQGQRSKVELSGDKKRKSAESSQLTMDGKPRRAL